MSIDSHRVTAQRGDTVHQEQSIRKIAEYLTNHGKGGQHSGRSLGVDDGKNLGRNGLEHLQSVTDSARIKRLAPLRVDSQEDTTATCNDVRHSLSEYSIHADRNGVSRFDQVDKSSLHPCAPGS